jgi:uncharacterized protein (UPF0254 family)
VLVLARKEIYIAAKHVITNRIFGECYMDTKEQVAKLIDYTLPKPDLTKEDTKHLYEETKNAFGLFMLAQPTRH